jgi:DNA-binding SARP family transcriptional activator
MQFAILGPLEARADGRRLSLGGPQQRALLAVLLVNANRVVSTDRLAHSLWGDHPPASARGLLQGCVAQLRRSLQIDEDGERRQPLVTRAPGYLLEVRPGEFDLDRFEELAAAARHAPPEQAASYLYEALALWRGPALEDIAGHACRSEATRLAERRLTVLEERIDADLRLGRHAEVVAELQAAVESYPLRERLWALLMLALHGADRQVEALAAYRRLRQTLVDQLGVEPGPTLRQLERAILSGVDAVEAHRQMTSAVPPGAAQPAPAKPGTAQGAAAHPGVTQPGVTQAGAEAAAGPAEPASAEPARPAQLPAAIAAFTGREPDLRRLDALLADADAGPPGGVVIGLVTGTAGVGKTALAVHWAHQVRPRFTDGQLYVNLRGFASAPPVRPIEALAGFLHTLGVAAEQMPVDLEQAAALYRSLLADKRLLVVLDNAHSADQVRPLLPGGTGCMVLITSRDSLGGLVARDGAHRLGLDVLRPDDAQTLLRRVLGHDRIAAEPEATDELARACGRLPLALRIAAASLTEQPERTLAGYVAELTGGDRLAALAVEDDADTAVRAAFDLSYTSLAAPAQRLFRLLGLVPGPDVTVGAAAALLDIDEPAAGRQLERLAAAHLIGRPAPNRYAFHDLLRLYAGERAHGTDGSADCAAAVGRLLDWYLHTADAAARALYPTMLRLPLPDRDPPTVPSLREGSATLALPRTFDDHTDALRWLDAELPNLSAAIQYGADHGPLPAAWLLADALRGYCWLRMYPVEWLAIASGGLAAALAGDDLRAQAAAQLSLADRHRCLNQHQAAAERYTDALRLARETDWLHGQATTLGGLGIVYGQWGRLSQAVRHFSQALEIDRRTGRLAGQTANLGNLGIVYRELGRLSESADHHAQALAINRKLRSRGGEAIDLSNLGETYQQLGELTEALVHLEQAVVLFREVGDRAGEAETLRRTADVHCAAGRLQQAFDLAHEAVALACDTGERRFEADARNTLGTVHHGEGRQADAIQQHESALRLARDIQTQYPAVLALIGLSAAHQRLGRGEPAHAYARQALAVAHDGGFRGLEGYALSALADLCLDGGDAASAADHARAALVIHRDSGQRLGIARTLLVLGRALGSTDGPAAARDPLREARALFAEMGVPAGAEHRPPPGHRARPWAAGTLAAW